MSSMGGRLQTIVRAWFRYQLSGSTDWTACAQRETQLDALQLSHSGKFGLVLRAECPLLSTSSPLLIFHSKECGVRRGTGSSLGVR